MKGLLVHFVEIQGVSAFGALGLRGACLWDVGLRSSLCWKGHYSEVHLLSVVLHPGSYIRRVWHGTEGSGFGCFPHALSLPSQRPKRSGWILKAFSNWCSYSSGIFVVHQLRSMGAERVHGLLGNKLSTQHSSLKLSLLLPCIRGSEIPRLRTSAPQASSPTGKAHTPLRPKPKLPKPGKPNLHPEVETTRT